MTSPDPRIEFFDRHAATWDSDGPSPHELIARLEKLDDCLELRPSQDLLEVGCGTGALTGWLVERVRPGRVTAVDFAPAMLERARQRGADADFVCLDVCNGDLGTARFDVIFCLHSFPHFRDQPAALAGFCRALRVGGRLIILHLDGWRNVNAFHDQVGGAVAGDHLPGPAQLTAMLRNAGLALHRLIDQPDLFCVVARRAADSPGAG